MIEVPLYRTDTVIPNVPLTNDKSRSVFTTITRRAEELVGGEAKWRIQGRAPLIFRPNRELKSLSQGRDERPSPPPFPSEGLHPPLRPQRKKTVSAWWLGEE